MADRYESTPAPRTRGRRAGLILGVAPQLLLLVVLLLFLSASTGQHRPYLGYLVFTNAVIVPVAALVAVPCLFNPAARLFGQVLLLTTGGAATAFTVICLTVTAE
ncbi:hypothetical protein AB0K00_09380 [Dactylosporangium sp. NPDC049525]|uniref:hypothetical protein n=1 Tax=Dactylosporangium sp. NPDC049525 TaxID=3154730 RepID=UPI0034209B7C